MELVANQPEEVKHVIQRNAYLAEPSLLLCSMLESEEKALRQQTVDKIHHIRAKKVHASLHASALPKSKRQKTIRDKESVQLPA